MMTASWGSIAKELHKINQKRGVAILNVIWYTYAEP